MILVLLKGLASCVSLKCPRESLKGRGQLVEEWS